MFSLLIDTSTERGVIAILNDSTLIYQAELPFGYQNSQYLLPEIAKAFEASGMTPQQLDFITLGQGPGSYTGIRLAASAAKAMAFALGIPVVGVGSLEGFVPDQDGAFAAILDAKVSGFYLLKGIKKEGTINLKSEPKVCALEDVQRQLEDVKVLVTPHAVPLQQKVPSSSHWEWQEMPPNASYMGRLGVQKFQQGDVSKDGRIELLYLRKTQAEIEKSNSA